MAEDHHFMAKAKQILETSRSSRLSIGQLKDAAIELAGVLMGEARRIETRREKVQESRLAALMDDPIGKIFTTNVTDQCFRSRQPSRVASQLIYLLGAIGIPRCFSWDRRAGLQAFKWGGKKLPKPFTAAWKHLLRKETSAVILPGEPAALAKHILKRRAEGVRVNLNHLGEAILGEEEALHRLKIYLEDLKRPEIEYISIKVSTICSQLNLLAWEDTLNILKERLRALYRTASSNMYKRTDGKAVPKFVNLDMEEYRDLSLTIELFKSVLDEPEFLGHSAGIVLQSYLPDSFLKQQELTEWALERQAKGGAPIKIRIVKGANLSMEQVEASLRGWPQAPYISKAEVDANYKRMLEYGCRGEHANAVNLGIGSHNLFDIAYGMLLRAQNHLEEQVVFEMLEGMADHLRRAVQTASKDMLLYCPAAAKEEFQHAVAYLVRRLDENTAPQNFLRHLFSLKPGTKDWEIQSNLFSASCMAASAISYTPRRTQDRFKAPQAPDACSSFANEPDTDWALRQNVKWVEQIVQSWSERQHPAIPLVIGGSAISTAAPAGIGRDPSFPGKVLYRFEMADSKMIDKALDTAKKAQQKWQSVPLAERSALLAAVAQGLREKRGDLIGCMIADTAKTPMEGDIEVSEAIDFAEYYLRNIEEVAGIKDIEWTAKGTVLVAPPWNFPCSIPAGGILAALASGNCVIFKPASEAALVGWEVVQVFWNAGISKEVLQFLCCEDEPAGSELVKDLRLDCVILTGATETAKHLLKLRPGLNLSAETGGKNALIITALSDRDLAIKDLVHSAFGHAGQKCSACSLAICEAEVYDDPRFREQLRDAAASLRVGKAWDLAAKLTPLIREPGETLMRGMTVLEPGEEWLLEPKQDPKNPRLWSPGIKRGVKEGSFTHQNEFFGPLLGIMRADNLGHAIRLANGTRFGLTAGIHTLDQREKDYWIEHIEAGNCYINRTITGAIVQRQPFGGCKESSFGRGAKAGGPNYLMQLMHAKQIAPPKEKDKLNEPVQALGQFVKGNCSAEETELWGQSSGSYAFYWNRYFSKDHDPSLLIGQDNILRYKPHPSITLRLQNADTLIDLLRAAAAAITCGAAFEISGAKEQLMPVEKAPALQAYPQVKIIIETEKQLIRRVEKGEIKRIRLFSKPAEELQTALAKSACNVNLATVLSNGRVELLHYVREISLSIDYHRYGYLGGREGEKRAPLKEAET